jgi:IS5 family transposase
VHRTLCALSLTRAIPDETTILNFRHLLEENDLAEDILQAGQRAAGQKGADAQARQHRGRHHHCRAQLDQEQHRRARPRDASDQEGQPVVLRDEGAHRGGCRVGPGAHGDDHAANEADVEQIADLLHGKENRSGRTRATGVAASGWASAKTCSGTSPDAPAASRACQKDAPRSESQKQEHNKASIRAKVEHPFRVIKRQFGLTKVRFKGLAKNTAHVVTLFALSNLWMARKKLMAMMGEVRAKAA